MARRNEISALRGRLGLTQARLAELVGVHAMTVSKWERGVLAPSRRQRELLRTFERAAERGVKLAAHAGSGKRKDGLRMLSEVLAQAHATPEIHLGTLSATNRFAGRVVELARGDVMSKVVIEVAPSMRIGSVITTDSLDRLGLEVGARAVAIIKATEVIVGGL